MASPLADRVRPTTIDGIVGQEALLGPGRPLRLCVERGVLPSLLLWGPPGCGKTTLARALARAVEARFVELSAVSVGVAALREAARDAERARPTPSVLFIDEIHRFSKSQQDAVLPHVESGLLILIGATTENPGFRVNRALRSRCTIFALEPVREEVIAARLREIAARELPALEVEPEALQWLARSAGGDLRRALNGLEVAARLGQGPLSAAAVRALVPEAADGFERGAGHYDCASAFQKSLRGSDADAALYYLGKMLRAGEDPLFICRRLTVCASEDVGLADPQALVQALSAWQVVERVGMPEGRIALAQATVYVARAPKSNAAYAALDAVLDTLKRGGDHPVPAHLRGSGGEGYVYTHDRPEVRQEFLPEPLRGTRFLPSSGPPPRALEAVAGKLRELGEGTLDSAALGADLGLARPLVVRCVRALARQGALELVQSATFRWKR